MGQKDIFAQIWKMSNEVRGQIEGWDFRHYVLTLLFYRFMSEDFARAYQTTRDTSNYAALSDDEVTPAMKNEAIKLKGYFIYPSQLFTAITNRSEGDG